MPAKMRRGRGPLLPRRRANQGNISRNISVWFGETRPPRQGRHSGALNGVSRGGRPRSRPWRGRPYHRRWPKPPPALPFSHRCSSLRSVCAQDDYIFDEFGSLFCSGSDASAVLCDDDDMSWLNAYGSNDALFPPTPAEAHPPSPQHDDGSHLTSSDGSRWASGCDVLSASELPLLCKHGR